MEGGDIGLAADLRRGGHQPRLVPRQVQPPAAMGAGGTHQGRQGHARGQQDPEPIGRPLRRRRQARHRRNHQALNPLQQARHLMPARTGDLFRRVDQGRGRGLQKALSRRGHGTGDVRIADGVEHQVAAWRDLAVAGEFHIPDPAGIAASGHQVRQGNIAALAGHQHQHGQDRIARRLGEQALPGIGLAQMQARTSDVAPRLEQVGQGLVGDGQAGIEIDRPLAVIFGRVRHADAEIGHAQALMADGMVGILDQQGLEHPLRVGRPVQFQIGVGQIKLGLGKLWMHRGLELDHHQIRIAGHQQIGGPAEQGGRLGVAGSGGDRGLGGHHGLGRATSLQQRLRQKGLLRGQKSLLRGRCGRRHRPGCSTQAP